MFDMHFARNFIFTENIQCTQARTFNVWILHIFRDTDFFHPIIMKYIALKDSS